MNNLYMNTIDNKMYLFLPHNQLSCLLQFIYKLKFKKEMKRNRHLRSLH